MRSDAPCWKTPKSARPTWIRSAAVRRTPGRDGEQRHDQRDPDRDPATVSPVRTDRRIRFRHTSPGQVTGV